MDTLHAIQHGERPAPINVEIFLSNRCSHGCVWCAYAHTHTRGPLAGKVDRPPGAIDSGDLMDTKLALNILMQLRDNGVKSVTWSGGGEPTLHHAFDEITLQAYLGGLEQGLYTHGGHINEKRAAHLKSTFTWVYISLDEYTPEAFKASKGVNRYDAVLTGIRNLVAAQGKAVIGLGFLLHPDNYHYVAQMVELGRSLGVDYVQFRPTIKYKQDAPSELDEDTTWVTRAIEQLYAYQDDEFVIADIGRFVLYRDWTGFSYDTCFWSAIQTAISPNGRVWRCTNKTGHADALLGDLSIESFADIWVRSGGKCSVTKSCRTLCRGEIANESLNGIMAPMPHANFI